jgi:hypothetical protein
MTDTLYLLGTVGFFALMLAYISFCERLGRSTDDQSAGTGGRP